ncbi:MAG: hypothetical protein AB9872_10970 [Solidesulfovibrio sp.]
MVDAVESGGYGVLGLYAAQVPTVPDSTPLPATTAGPDAQVSAVAPVEAAQAVGSGPVAAADPEAGSGNSGGRDYSGEGQALARQTAVAASLAEDSASEEAKGQDTDEAPAADATSAPSSGRAFRAYAQAGNVIRSVETGVMVAISA